jgi:hypothetical protein
VCPSCRGALTQFRSEEDFFIAVVNFQNGFGPKRQRFRKHPGYVEFTQWMKRRCFANTLEAAKIYRATTGCEVDIKEEDFE